jgi:phosphatidylserine/phosphatidylglycerophosphate/cardiolipin synthase-like enzyme
MYTELVEFGIIKTDFKTLDFMHNKFIVIDNRTVWTGSMNPTLNGAYYNNDNVIVINSTELACNYKTEFFEMWNGSFSKGSPANTPYPIVYVNGTEIECYFAPEDGVEDQIVDELKNANNSVYFAIFTFTSKPIAETLIDLHSRGVKVKGIYEKRQNSTWCTYKMLDEAGIDVIWDKNPKTMHHKFFIIDNTTTITGSYNPTKHANTANDENILIIHNDNISNEYVNEFFEMWNEWQPTSSIKTILTPTNTHSSSYTSVSGFGLAITIAGLLAVKYILLRRRG